MIIQGKSILFVVLASVMLAFSGVAITGCCPASSGEGYDWFCSDEDTQQETIEDTQQETMEGTEQEKN